VHFAYVVRDGIDRTYVDGILSSETTDACLSRLNGASMHLGSALMADAGRILDSFGGKLDWIRISSVARYSGEAFTVPTEDELVPDAQTNLWVTFNGTSTEDAFIDQSPHHYALTAGVGVSGGTVPPIVPDCNGNGNDDRVEIAQGLLVDSNADAVPDICQCGSMPELPSCCVGDIFADGIVNGGDLGVLLSYWGPTTASAASRRCDIDGNGVVNGADMGIVLAGWGPCASNNVPAWATALETEPDPSVVTDPALRAAIVATGRPWRVRDNSTGIEMVLIPPGSFQMGCSASNAWGCWGGEYPVHLVTLTNAFYLSRCEVTQAQWQARMGSNPAYFSNANGQSGSDDRPVERVSWSDIQGFLTNVGMRLPTEAEWEYAYRAGTTTAYHGWSATPEGTNDDSKVGEIGWYLYNTCYGDGCGTRAVGLKASNGFGLKDMLGNVWEWVNDWYDGYASGEQFNPNGPPSGTQRVFRGGSWFSSSPSFNVRSSFRISQFPDYNNENIGFRVARNP
jgi:formylglycine-generating enzyme required for sulfatase activity